MSEIKLLQYKLRKFAEERDWDKFHSPKNLVIALMVESGELAEHYQWLTERQSVNLSGANLDEVSKEAADVFIYLLRFADMAGIDLIEVAKSKIIDNAKKYPVEEIYGSAEKR